MNLILRHSIRFVFLLLFQTMVLNQLEIGWGIQIMVYPIFLFLLPFELSVSLILLISFAMGLLIDSISNTYGLHTSALVMMAYFRPIIFKAFAPRDGYDPLKEGTIYDMGGAWFFSTFGILLVIHHFWFFLIEMFRLDALLFVLQKTILSFAISLVFCLLLQMLFIRKNK
ncbi:MAG: hypothetical protein V4638_09585 [Bacteroidota bacterium]